jgi:hypothetical protein
MHDRPLSLADLQTRSSPHGSLVALSTMKDEGPYVVEWVAHHLALGFTELMVYTNDCSDGTDALLKRLDALGIGVHHRENVIPEGMKPHPSMLKSAVQEELIITSDWLLVLDADEFLSLNHPSGTLDGLVADLNAMDAHAMVITWRIFGSSNIRDWNRNPITQQFTWAAPPFWNKGWGTKTLLRFDPKYLRLGMHRPIIKAHHRETDYPEKVLWVNGSGRPMEEWFKFRGWRSIRRTLGYDWAQMNHYAIKSMDAFSLRKYRGNANLKKDKYNSDYWALQDRNEVEDFSIQKHLPRTIEVMKVLLEDPEVARLHDAAHARAEATLAEYREQPEYQTYVAQLVEAGKIPVTQVVAKPPKARDPEAVRAVQTKIEKRRNALPKSERRTLPPVSWGDPGASPYVAGEINLANDIALEEVDNQGIKIPVDPRVFTPLALEAVQAGKFDRRHARNINKLLEGVASVLDVQSGIGFIGLKAHLTRPDLIVLNHEERACLSELGQKMLQTQFPDEVERVRFITTPLRLEGAESGPLTGLAKLVAAEAPECLRLPHRMCPATDLSSDCFDGVAQVILPFLDPSEVEVITQTIGATLTTEGFALIDEFTPSGSVVYRRS